MHLQAVLSALLVYMTAAVTQNLGLSDLAFGIALTWPSKLPGHGNLSVDMAAIANITNSTVLTDLISTHHLPNTFTISKKVNKTCDGRVEFDNITAAVAGDLCLGPGTSYTAVVDAFLSIVNTDMIISPSEDDICGCFCTCSIACMALLLLAPLCWAGCAACPAGSG